MADKRQANPCRQADVSGSDNCNMHRELAYPMIAKLPM